MERTLSSPQRALELQFQPTSSLDAYASHFAAVNGYGEGEQGVVSLPPAALLLQETVSVAFALQVLLDATPGWKTLVGKYEAPLSASRDVSVVLQELLDKGGRGCERSWKGARREKTNKTAATGENGDGEGAGNGRSRANLTKRRLEEPKAGASAMNKTARKSLKLKKSRKEGAS